MPWSLLRPIFAPRSENSNETVEVTYQGYVARACTFVTGRRGVALLRRALPIVAGAALLTSTAGDADAYVIKRTSRGELVHWEGHSVDYTFDASVGDAVPASLAATKDAMGSWSGTVGAPELVARAPDADAPAKPSFDQKNGIFYYRGGYKAAGRALAITVLTYDNVSGRILDADIIFNGIYNFAVLPPAEFLRESASLTHVSATDGVGHDDELRQFELPGEAVYDLHHVVAHELGHSLGMNDEIELREALMYRYSSPNDASVREPSPDDIAGLAELYSTKLEGRGNGCGEATVAPKKPTSAAAQTAMVATLGLLLFLLLRARSDRRARLAFMAASAIAAVAAMPSLTGKRGTAAASERAADAALGHAKAKVLAATTALEGGLFKTQYQLATVSCNAASCPKSGVGEAWGGTIGNVTQEVGDHYAPTSGDEVDVSFSKLPAALSAVSNPLAGRLAAQQAAERSTVRVVTRHRGAAL